MEGETEQRRTGHTTGEKGKRVGERAGRQQRDSSLSHSL